MGLALAIVTMILIVASSDVIANRSSHSKPWICTHLVKKTYNDAILNVVATPGVSCFDELLALPGKIKYMTPIKTSPSYMVVGPYIGKSNSFRIVQVVEDELENIDLGTKIEGKFAVECLKCNGTYYGDNIGGASCKELTMEECPERLSKEIYWNPPGIITASSDAQFCLYRKNNDIQEYLCMFLEPNLDVIS